MVSPLHAFVPDWLNAEISTMDAPADKTDEDRQEAFQNVMLAYHLAHMAIVPTANNHEVLR